MSSTLFKVFCISTASLASGSRNALSLVQLSTRTIEPWKPVEGVDNTNFIHATEEIDGNRESCRDHTCSYGMLLCEKLLQYGRSKKHDTEIAIFNAGGIRGSIRAGEVTQDSLIKVHPYNDTISFFKLTGADIKDQLKRVLKLHGGPGKGAHGSWLQVAGIRFSATWHGKDWTLDAVKVQRGMNASWVDLNETATYNLVTNSYMMSGKGGFSILKYRGTDIVEDPKAVTHVMFEYFRHNTPVEPPMADARVTLMAYEAQQQDAVNSSEDADNSSKTLSMAHGMELSKRQEPTSTTSNAGDSMIWEEYGKASSLYISNAVFLVVALTSGFILP